MRKLGIKKIKLTFFFLKERENQADLAAG